MHKKVAVDDVRVGMKVVELDINWMNSPFWRHAFKIKSDKEIRQIKQFCKFVVIDLNESDLAATNHLRQKISDQQEALEAQKTAQLAKKKQKEEKKNGARRSR